MQTLINWFSSSDESYITRKPSSFSWGIWRKVSNYTEPTCLTVDLLPCQWNAETVRWLILSHEDVKSPNLRAYIQARQATLTDAREYNIPDEIWIFGVWNLREPAGVFIMKEVLSLITHCKQINWTEIFIDDEHSDHTYYIYTTVLRSLKASI